MMTKYWGHPGELQILNLFFLLGVEIDDDKILGASRGIANPELEFILSFGPGTF